MSAIRGYPSQQKLERTDIQFTTVEPVRAQQNGMSVVAHQFVFQVGTDAAEAGSTASVINATGHLALEGDIIRLTSGALSGREIKVYSVAANTITLVEDLSVAVSTGVTFEILRHKYPSVDSDGVINVNATIVEAALAPDGGALPADLKVVAGYDGAAVQVLKTDAAGELQVDVLSSALPAGAATEATLATLATEATVATLATEATVATLATEATVATLATEATVSTLATEATVSTLATEATVSTLATEATVSTLATEATVSTLATEATVSTLATEATVSTLGTETTLAAIKTSVELLDNAVSGNELQVDVVTSALPTGAATETTLASIEGDTSALAGCVAGTEIQVDVVSSALPSGAATSAAQTDGTQKSQIVDAAGDIADVKLLSVALAGTDKGLVTNTIIHGETTGGGGGYVDVKVTPSGALTTESTLAGLDAAVLGQDTMANSLPVVIASNQSSLPVTPATLSVVDLLDAGILDTSSTNIAGSASNPTQVVATLAAAVKKIQLLDTTGAFIGVYTGAALSEVLQFVMGPGSDQTIEHSIPAGTRISVKCLDSTSAVTSGILAINFLG